MSLLKSLVTSGVMSKAPKDKPYIVIWVVPEAGPLGRNSIVICYSHIQSTTYSVYDNSDKKNAQPESDLGIVVRKSWSWSFDVVHRHDHVQIWRKSWRGCTTDRSFARPSGFWTIRVSDTDRSCSIARITKICSWNLHDAGFRMFQIFWRKFQDLRLVVRQNLEHGLHHLFDRDDNFWTNARGSTQLAEDLHEKIAPSTTARNESEPYMTVGKWLHRGHTRNLDCSMCENTRSEWTASGQLLSYRNV